MLFRSIEKQKADAQSMVAQAKVDDMAAKSGLGGAQQQIDPLKMAELQLKNRELNAKESDAHLDAINRLRDRESRERLAAVKLAEEMAENPSGIPIVQSLLHPDMIDRLEANEPPLGEG